MSLQESEISDNVHFGTVNLDVGVLRTLCGHRCNGRKWSDDARQVTCQHCRAILFSRGELDKRTD